MPLMVDGGSDSLQVSLVSLEGKPRGPQAPGLVFLWLQLPREGGPCLGRRWGLSFKPTLPPFPALGWRFRQYKLRHCVACCVAHCVAQCPRHGPTCALDGNKANSLALRNPVFTSQLRESSVPSGCCSFLGTVAGGA